MVFSGESYSRIFHGVRNDIKEPATLVVGMEWRWKRMEKKTAVMKIESYSGKDGMMLLSVSDFGVRTMLKDFCDYCCKKFSGYVKLEMTPPFPKRTTGKYSQNHHLNGHILQICNETGNSYDTIKYCIKMLAVEQMGYPYEQMDGYIIPKGERDCNMQECSMLIEAAHVWAAEHGIVLDEGE